MWFALILLGAVTYASAQYYGNYHCTGDKDVFVHLFEWKWTDVAKECEEYLGPNGFCGVQVSPANEHRIIVNEAGYKSYPWYQRYQPVSYLMTSRSGTENQFRDMVSRCNDAGVRIYVDAVLNHMTKAGTGTGSAGSAWDGNQQSYPGVPYSNADFHGSDVCFTSDLNIHNYNNADEVRYCRLDGLRDLRSAKSYVQDKIVEFLNKLIGWGVAGFRIDASKHMFPADTHVMMNRLNNLPTQWFPANTKPFIFMEVIDMGGSEPIKNTHYTHIGRVTEFRYGKELGDVIRKNNNQRLAYLRNFGEGWGFIAGMSAVSFVDNHDNQRGHGAGGFGTILTFFENKMYKMANAFMLAWPYGFVRLMSSYRWPRNIQDGKDVNDWMGPPYTGAGNTKDVSCFGEWVCEHKWRQISNMVKFHNTVVGEPVRHWWDNGFQAIAFARGDKGFIAINNEDFVISQTFTTGLPDGQYCDVINCENKRPPCGFCEHQRDSIFQVSNGRARIVIRNDADPVVAIHV